MSDSFHLDPSRPCKHAWKDLEEDTPQRILGRPTCLSILPAGAIALERLLPLSAHVAGFTYAETHVPGVMR